MMVVIYIKSGFELHFIADNCVVVRDEDNRLIGLKMDHSKPDCPYLRIDEIAAVITK